MESPTHEGEPRRETGHVVTAGGAVLRVDLAYLGTAFHGWQKQRGLRTVQGELSAALATLLGREIVPVAAGRTDSGVHARGQVCSLAVAGAREADLVCRRLNRLVPADVQILDVRRVSSRFHARFSATSRRYSYHMLLWRDVFLEPLALFVSHPLDRDAMDEAAARFVGTWDFAGFSKQSSLASVSSTVCRIDLCGFEWGPGLAILHVRADRFLHNMVRIIAGSLLDVGRGRRSPDDISALIAARERARVGRTLPPHGLFLEEVTYPADLLAPDAGQASTPEEAQ